MYKQITTSTCSYSLSAVKTNGKEVVERYMLVNYPYEPCLQTLLACSPTVTPSVSKLSPVMADGCCGLVAAEDKHGGSR